MQWELRTSKKPWKKSVTWSEAQVTLAEKGKLEKKKKKEMMAEVILKLMWKIKKIMAENIGY